MSKYYIGLYSKGRPFNQDVTQVTLGVIHNRLPEFFPAKFETIPGVFSEIKVPSDFSYDIIPKEFWVEDGISVRIPISGNNGTELTILDDRDSTLTPSNILLNWSSKDMLPETSKIEYLFAGLIETLHPTSAIVTEEEMRLREDIYERSFNIDNAMIPESLYWMTWLGPKHMQTIGKGALEIVKNLVTIFSCASGYILILQQEPYEDGNPEHRHFREDVEEKIGLATIYKNLGFM